MLAPALGATLDGDQCPHMAVLLKRDAELMPVLASFYALGAKRRGWLVHRAVQGQGEHDRAALAEAGLDVAGLEARGQLAIVEFDPSEPPERSTDPWERGLERALGDGFEALWYSRFAVGADPRQYATVLPYERAWQACFHGRPVVTLCPYVVGALDATETLERLATLASTHDTVLVPEGDAFRSVQRA